MNRDILEIIGLAVLLIAMFAVVIRGIYLIYIKGDFPDDEPMYTVTMRDGKITDVKEVKDD